MRNGSSEADGFLLASVTAFDRRMRLSTSSGDRHGNHEKKLSRENTANRREHNKARHEAERP